MKSLNCFFKHCRSQISLFLSFIKVLQSFTQSECIFFQGCRIQVGWLGIIPPSLIGPKVYKNCLFKNHKLLVAHPDFNSFLQPCFSWDFYNQMYYYYYVTRTLISISFPVFQGCSQRMGVGFSNRVSIFQSSFQCTKCLECHTLSSSLLNSYNPNHLRLPYQILSASHTSLWGGLFPFSSLIHTLHNNHRNDWTTYTQYGFIRNPSKTPHLKVSESQIKTKTETNVD